VRTVLVLSFMCGFGFGTGPRRMLKVFSFSAELTIAIFRVNDRRGLVALI
jgi:hypothetical protein